jgi:hypothetical protein
MRRGHLLLALALAGCAPPPSSVPDDVPGPIATFADTAQRRGSTSVDFFYLKRINGKEVDNSIAATMRANEGEGFGMKPVILDHRVPTDKATFTIEGRTHYAAPILELTNTVYDVIGRVTFAPLPNHVYRVAGSLREERSSVWVEDEATGEIIGGKITVEGSTAQGILSK